MPVIDSGRWRAFSSRTSGRSSYEVTFSVQSVTIDEVGIASSLKVTLQAVKA